VLAALFDIGSGSVRGALALLESGPGAPPRLIAAASEDFLFQEKVRADRLRRSLSAALAKIAAALAEKARERGGRITHAMLTFSAPWYVAETKLLHFESEKPFEVTRATIDALIEEGWRRFGTTPSSSPHLAQRAREAETSLMEQAISSIALNGYRTRSPLGKSAQSLDIALYLSRAPREVLEEIDTLIGERMPGVRAVPHSASLVLTSVVQSLFPDYADFVLCHVSAETTETGFVSEEVLGEVASFPYGAHTLVRELASAMKTIPGEVLSLLSLGEGARDARAERRLALALAAVRERWLQEWRRALASYEDSHGSAAGRVIVVGENPALTAIFMRFLGEAGPASLAAGAPAAVAAEGLPSGAGPEAGGGLSKPLTLPSAVLGTALICEGSAAPCTRDTLLSAEALYAARTLLSTE
jgi:hypothetical protein